MATIKKFEDLISWRKARELTRYIYYLTKKEKFSKDYGLKDQIQRSAVSTMANQAEGFCRGTKIELINYFYITKGSAGEVQSHLYVALDQGYITKGEFQKGYRVADEVQRLIQNFVDKVKKNSLTGLQYRQPKMPTQTEKVKRELEKEDKVLTERGIMYKKEAEKLGLKSII